jgi:hypothetical protein
MDHGLSSRCDQPSPGAPLASPWVSLLSIQGSRTPCPAPRDRRHAPTGPPPQIPARRTDGPLGARVAPASQGASFIFGHPRDTAALASRTGPFQVALRPPDQPPKADTRGSTTPRLAPGHREPDLGLPADPGRAQKGGSSGLGHFDPADTDRQAPSSTKARDLESIRAGPGLVDHRL